MKKFISALLGLSLVGAPILAQPDVKSNSLNAQGCMKLRECTNDVERITSFSQLTDRYGDDWASPYKKELTTLITLMNKSGVEIYIAPDRYFVPNTRGLYYTDVNRLFLNNSHVRDEYVFTDVFRHEGWHAAQDCMAGTIENSFIAVIHNDEEVPQRFQLSAEVRYGMMQARAIPWEQEAIWAGNTPYMTQDALASCASDTPMWWDYKPTPKTAEWLTTEGYTVIPPTNYERHNGSR